MTLQGILNFNKPRGPTAFAVVHLVRRLTGVAKVGHAGTLDPLAEGVLPICLGRAAKIVPYLLEGRKVYQAQITLGAATDTYDAQGRVTHQADASGLARAAVDEALRGFFGPQEQVPPMHSAIKVGGIPLYRLARRGLEVPRSPRRVHIYRLEFQEWQPPVATIEVECSKGTYIRSLAHDLGLKLGCGAHLSGLVRLQDGPFHIKDSVDLCQFHEAIKDATWESLIYPADYPLQHFPAVILGPEQEASFRHGRSLALPPPPPGQGRCRAYSQPGRFLGLLRYLPEEAQWRGELLLDL